MPERKIILVDEKDNPVGEGEKLRTHQEGRLHRAFSIFVFNSRGQLLLQKRAKGKYHSGGLWTNTCCSHPEPDKNLVDEAEKRLQEEMGFTCDLKEVSSFIYKTDLGDLVEYEFDHVFLGKYDDDPKPDKEEVEDWKWMDLAELKQDMKENPQNYTYWFQLIIEKGLDVT